MENIILRRYFNTERHLQAVQSVNECDGYTDEYAIELGTHDIPKWLWQELYQAVDHSKGRLPIAVIHQKGDNYDDSIVMIRLGDFYGKFLSTPKW